MQEIKYQLRPVEPEDVIRVHELILELADFEKLSHAVRGSAEQLHQRLFGENAKLFCQVCVETESQKMVGMVLYFYNYSSFLARHGLYIEDLYVTPECRGGGVGKRLLQFVIDRAKSEGLGRVEWAVLDWNTPAIEFYKSMGAEPMSEWTSFRLSL